MTSFCDVIEFFKQKSLMAAIIFNGCNNRAKPCVSDGVECFYFNFFYRLAVILMQVENWLVKACIIQPFKLILKLLRQNLKSIFVNKQDYLASKKRVKNVKKK